MTTTRLLPPLFYLALSAPGYVAKKHHLNIKFVTIVALLEPLR